MKHALIVDDKDENLYYLEALLGGHGLRVTRARHGAEALVLARREPPDVVVSDLLMPVMDGYTLLRYWKADERLRGIPFIVYTATYTEQKDERLALDLGADAFILKPTEPEDFLARLRAVGTRPVATPLRQEPPPDEDQLLKVYNETLVRKLEKKAMELEEANAALRRDVARRELAEAALRDSEQRFRQLAENIEEVFWISDADKRRVLYVSPAYEAVWAAAWRRCTRNRASGWRPSIPRTASVWPGRRRPCRCRAATTRPTASCGPTAACAGSATAPSRWPTRRRARRASSAPRWT